MIKPTGDSKTRFWKNQKNTYGLLPVVTCPGATFGIGGCANKMGKNMTCYVDALTKCYPGVYTVLKHNTDKLMSTTLSGMYSLIDEEFKRFHEAELKHAKRHNCKPNLNYRIHWSGDVFNDTYALALGRAMAWHTDIQFWGYTRTFNTLHRLLAAPNLNLYLSVDPVNLHDGLRTLESTYRQNAGHLHMAFMGTKESYLKAFDGFITSDKTIQALGSKLRACPTTAGKLATADACATCMRCVRPRKTGIDSLLFVC